MKRLILFTVLLLMQVEFSAAQQSYIDSLLHELNISKNDTDKLIRLITIARLAAEIDPDSSYHYAEQSLKLARKLHLKLDEAGALREMSYAFLNKGNYPRALQTVLSAMAVLEDPESEQQVLVGKFPGDDELMYRGASPHAQRLCGIAFIHQVLGVLYANSYNYQKSLHHHLLGRQKAEQSGSVPMQSLINLTLNRVYLHLKKTDSAMIAIQRSYEQAMKSGYKRYLGSVLLNMGRTYSARGNISLANQYYRKSLVASAESGYLRGVVASNLILANYYSEAEKRDSAFLYIKNALAAAQTLDAPELLLRSYTSLTRYYRTVGNSDSTVKYQALIIRINDSLFNVKQVQQFQNIDFDAQQRQQEILTTKKGYQNRLQKYLLLSGLGVVLIVASILFRNNKQKQRTNRKLEKTLADLKSTQSQLIQSEKMASLGELTAGIAHEIQNPLNFVNNFSDVNTELLVEMKDEMDKGHIDDAKAIAGSVIENEQKINHHGKRADAIVKNMLQHSRSSSNVKEPTDINALTDEYLRLAYRGLRAKDKDFNAVMQTDFDTSIGQINIIPQDIGRVLLNIYTNAFYAVSEKKRLVGEIYEPTVLVCTKRINSKVEIRVKDNGNGIPQKVIDKIFQPFFTTKPTGQGTGLGLSLSYDIVKAHGGVLNVTTNEGEGSEFTIELPTA